MGERFKQDLINRADAIEAVFAVSRRVPTMAIRAKYALESLPSAEHVTGKLKNPCDSLLTEDNAECKEQKSKLDLISRQDAIDAVKQAIYNHDSAIMRITSLPSAEAVQGEWIPVSDRLPEWHWDTIDGDNVWIGERVLACVKEADEWYESVGIATYGPYGWVEGDEAFYSCTEPIPVIAWMPLPKPYERSESDETD